MRNLTLCGAAALALSAAPALAWDDSYKGDATHNPNSNVLMHSVPNVENNCPTGLQPVMMGGVICCGEPNAGPYVNRAGGTKRYVAKTHRHAYAPVGEKGVYAPIGEKGVIYR